MHELWKMITSPSARFSLATLVITGLIVGFAGAVGVDFAMEATSTDEFCLSCHELAENVGKESEGTVHHTNKLGLRVTCADCHLPKPIGPKIYRKLRAVNEIYHHLLGTIDTPEKFDAHRERMAGFVWAEMNESDSRECRNCHKTDLWDVSKQTEKAREYHGPALSKGKTCIDCHKGLSHKLPPNIREDTQLKGIDF